MTPSRTISSRGALAALLLPLALVALAFATTSVAVASSAGAGCTGGYGWPVKPFDRAHPIRGAFGDPRTVFDGASSAKTVLAADGRFSFHHGVDISAPDATPVYAVASGTVVRTHGNRVTVDCGNGRIFEYWHLEPATRVGRHAEAGKTLLGYIQEKREHVHLRHIEAGRSVNPVAGNRLTPYSDSTVPEVLRISARRDGHRIAFVARAVDMPSLPVPGRWHGFPVTPALVTWRIQTRGGRVVVPTRVARDVRETIPSGDQFWTTFARGSHQNWPVFTDGKARGMTGRYVFRLTSGWLDTRGLADGRYVLVVVAQDTEGNRDVRRLRFDLSSS